MTIHEYGKGNDNVIVLIHPSIVMWDYFQDVIPLLEDEYHVLVPTLPGYNTAINGGRLEYRPALFEKYA